MAGIIGKNLERLIYLVKNEGLLSIFIRVYRRVFSRHHAEYLRRKAIVDHAFDTAHGLDTGGVQHPSRSRTVGDAAASATSHIAIPPDEFASALNAISLPLPESTFIDLGSGKGRALVLAEKLPFRRLIGVEFAIELHEIAERNFAALGIRTGEDERVELINADATRFVFPAEPVVLFLYHPFGPPVMTRVAETSLAAYRSSGHPMQVAYVNPVHLDEWLKLGWQLRERTGTHAILNPPVD